MRDIDVEFRRAMLFPALRGRFPNLFSVVSCHIHLSSQRPVAVGYEKCRLEHKTLCYLNALCLKSDGVCPEPLVKTSFLTRICSS